MREIDWPVLRRVLSAISITLALSGCATRLLNEQAKSEQFAGYANAAVANGKLAINYAPIDDGKESAWWLESPLDKLFVHDPDYGTNIQTHRGVYDFGDIPSDASIEIVPVKFDYDGDKAYHEKIDRALAGKSGRHILIVDATMYTLRISGKETKISAARYIPLKTYPPAWAYPLYPFAFIFDFATAPFQAALAVYALSHANIR